LRRGFPGRAAEAKVDRWRRSHLVVAMDKSPRVPPKPAPSASAPKPPGPAAPRELGWLPDCVYTGEKFETGLAFFADALGRLARFSREPQDLAMARRLPGQAALPGFVNGHSHCWHRAVRGRAEGRPRQPAEPLGAWHDALTRAAGGLTAEDIFDTARLAFLEMLASGITCVGEFHELHHQPEGAPWPEPGLGAREILRAAHDVGIRLALFPVANGSGGPARTVTPSAGQFVRETEALRTYVEKNYPADEAWLGVGASGVGAVPPDFLKAIATYAHAQKLRVHVQVAERAADHAACVAAHGRTPIALLAECGLVDKRFTAVNAIHLGDDDLKVLGAARAAVCACPTSARNLGLGVPPIDQLLAAGTIVALGSDTQVQIAPLEDARLLDYDLRQRRGQRAVLAPDVATPLFHAATFAGARSLGGTGGALEVGRPADFFTVNLFDPSLAGADPASLLNHLVFSLERRAIREVWIGGRQLVVNGRHAQQGPIVGRFVDAQRRLWG
jgi:formimidoylglutamate deiminase